MAVMVPLPQHAPRRSAGVADPILRGKALALLAAAKVLADKAAALAATDPVSAITALSGAIARTRQAGTLVLDAVTLDSMPPQMLTSRHSTGLVWLHNTESDMRLESIEWDVVASFHNGKTKRFRRTMSRLFFDAGNIPPSSFVPVATTFEVGGQLLRQVLRDYAAAKGTGLASHTGTLIVRAEEIAPFFVPVRYP